MLIKELRENPLYIFLLLFLFIGYAGLHIEYPNKDAVFSHLGLNWQQLKDEFHDENGDMYFLSFDSYYYLNEAKQDKELDSGGLLSWLVRLDYRLNGGRILFTPYISFFFGALVLLLVFYIAFLYSKSFYISWLAAAFLMFDKYFFSITLFYFLDTNVLNVFFTLMLFLCVYMIVAEQNPFRRLLWCSIFLLFLMLYMWAWNGWVMILVLLFFFVCLLLVSYWDHFSIKKRAIIFGCLGILFLFMGIFLARNKLFMALKIWNYFFGYSLNIAELGRLDFDVFYSLLIIVCIIFSFIFMYYLIRKSKELDLRYILLYSFMIPLMVVGVLSKRFIIFFLPFAYILISLEFEILWVKVKDSFWAPPKRVMWGLFFIILIIVYSNNIGSYNGLLYGFPVVEKSLEETGEWINENLPQKSMIISFWDYSIFYEYFSNRTAKYKSSPVGMEQFSKAVLSKNLTKENEFLTDGIIVIDTHIGRQIPNIEDFAHLSYTDKTLLYHFLQGKSFGNYNLVNYEIGIRDTYYIYEYSYDKK